MIEEQISVWTLDIVHAGLQKNIRGLIKIWGDLLSIGQVVFSYSFKAKTL